MTFSSRYSLYYLCLSLSFSLSHSQVYTRKTLEEVDPNSELMLSTVADKFKERHQEVSNLAKSLHASYSHVYRSAMGGLLAVV